MMPVFVSVPFELEGVVVDALHTELLLYVLAPYAPQPYVSPNPCIPVIVYSRMRPLLS
jgi:hypothetical protein